MKEEVNKEINEELKRARAYIDSGRARDYKHNILFITNT